MSSFHGKVIAVTGAASGIGLATVEYLASLGAKLSLTDVAEEALAALAKRVAESVGRDNVFHLAADIRNSEAIDNWVAETILVLGELDGAVNTAGVHPKESGAKPMWEVTDDDWSFAQEVNVSGVRNCVRAELRHMVAAVKSGEKSTASIVNFGSNSSVVGAPNLSAYVTSKHAMIGLTRAAALDAAAFNIRVNALCPGPIDTPMLRNAVPDQNQLEAMQNDIPLRRLGSAKDLAGFVAFLLGDQSNFCTGSIYMADGGLTAA